ncbi:hypothetical protein TNIN_124661 [Trichonephila inaurata madagascariensis]|uniref:Uncharacterized protein n=1 Tax=Trichonephila inaurata madagascariensis TaxID=2747483 RepID=A0A8X6WS99_9ARAC|nr:hypothetical protein TNIN_124661 [Trichonephila inaurata madagascariensis]
MDREFKEGKCVSTFIERGFRLEIVGKGVRRSRLPIRSPKTMGGRVRLSLQRELSASRLGDDRCFCTALCLKVVAIRVPGWTHKKKKTAFVSKEKSLTTFSSPSLDE